jgi:ABC-type phosphate transport system substrate-binding protein
MGRPALSHKWRPALAAVSLLFVWHSSPAAIAIIGNPKLPVNSLTAEQISDIFLEKMTTLPDGTRIVVIDHQDGEPVKDSFYQDIVGKTLNQLKAYWAKIIFTGAGLPPRTFSGDESVKEEVSMTPGAIGYISTKSVDASVKVLFEQGGTGNRQFKEK